MNDRKASQPEDNRDATAKPEKIVDPKASLTTEDLDQVSGGINPQPLPPMRRDAQ